MSGQDSPLPVGGGQHFLGGLPRLGPSQRSPWTGQGLPNSPGLSPSGPLVTILTSWVLRPSWLKMEPDCWAGLRAQQEEEWGWKENSLQELLRGMTGLAQLN